MVVRKKRYGEDEPAMAATFAASSGPIINGVTAGVIVFFITRLLDRALFGRKS